MPDGGDVTSVDQSPRSEGESQVRVYGVPPQDGAQPTNIVRSFLDATTSDEADFRTATQYLAKSAKRTWRPFQVTNVLQERPKPEPKAQPNREDANGYTVTLSGSQVAAVDDSHAYTPEEKPYRRTIHLIKEDGQWRIDRLPNGLVLGLSDFQRIYRSVNKYYFASYNSESQEPKANRNVLVADPVYLRQRIKPITASVEALLSGPTDWLNHVTTSAFPTGTRLAAHDLALDDSNALRVKLSKHAVSTDTAQCKQMAAQLFFTVQDMTRASKISEVELQDNSGNSLCCTVPGAGRAGLRPVPGHRALRQGVLHRRRPQGRRHVGLRDRTDAGARAVRHRQDPAALGRHLARRGHRGGCVGRRPVAVCGPMEDGIERGDPLLTSTRFGQEPRYGADGAELGRSGRSVDRGPRCARFTAAAAARGQERPRKGGGARSRRPPDQGDQGGR